MKLPYRHLSNRGLSNQISIIFMIGITILIALAIGGYSITQSPLEDSDPRYVTESTTTDNAFQITVVSTANTDGTPLNVYADGEQLDIIDPPSTGETIEITGVSEGQTVRLTTDSATVGTHTVGDTVGDINNPTVSIGTDPTLNEDPEEENEDPSTPTYVAGEWTATDGNQQNWRTTSGVSQPAGQPNAVEWEYRNSDFDDNNIDPVTTENKLLIVAENQEENNNKLLAFDKQTGEILWEHTEYERYGQPSVDDGVIYIDGRNRLAAISLETGTEKWQTTEFEDVDDIAISEERLYIDDERLVAVDKSDGSKIWSVKESSNLYRTIHVGDEQIYVNAGSGVSYAVTPDGTVQWKNTESVNLGGQIVVDGDTVVMPRGVFNDGTVYAYDTETGDLKWETDVDHRVDTSVLGNDKVLVSDGNDWDGLITALDITTGEQEYDIEAGRDDVHSMVVIDDKLYSPCAYEEYGFCAFDESDGSVLWATRQIGHYGTDVSPEQMSVGDGVIYAIQGGTYNTFQITAVSYDANPEVEEKRTDGSSVEDNWVIWEDFESNTLTNWNGDTNDMHISTDNTIEGDYQGYFTPSTDGATVSASFDETERTSAHVAYTPDSIADSTGSISFSGEAGTPDASVTFTDAAGADAEVTISIGGKTESATLRDQIAYEIVIDVDSVVSLESVSISIYDYEGNEVLSANTNYTVYSSIQYDTVEMTGEENFGLESDVFRIGE